MRFRRLVAHLVKSVFRPGARQGAFSALRHCVHYGHLTSLHSTLTTRSTRCSASPVPSSVHLLFAGAISRSTLDVHLFVGVPFLGVNHAHESSPVRFILFHFVECWYVAFRRTLASSQVSTLTYARPFLEHTFYLTCVRLVNRMPIMNTDTVVSVAQPEINAASAYIASLSSSTSRSTMRSRLNIVARLMGAADASSVNWATLNAANVAALVAQVKGSASTKNQTLAALKGVARAAWRLGQMSTDEYERVRDVRSARSSRELAGKDVERDELAAILKTCKSDASPAGARDAAMFALAASCGLRRCELAALKMGDVRMQGDELEIKFIGKGDKERTAYVFNGALKALRKWMDIRGAAPGGLFCAIDKFNRMQHAHHMSTVAIHKRFAQRCADAGVEHVRLHDLRRTWVGEMLDAGADIVTVATLAGHSDVRTTQRYDRRPSAVRRAAACKVQVPY